MRALLVVNPKATATTPAGRDVLTHALASALDLHLVETGYRGHAVDAARKAAADGFELVVVHGGDGTVNEVVNGLLADRARDETPALGVVPGGSANVFARALGLPRDPVEATHHLLAAVEDERVRTIGLGRVDERWFTFNAGLGWDADVVADVEKQRVRRSAASPWLYARTALANYLLARVPRPGHRRRPQLTIELPGERPIGRFHLAFVSNTDPWTYLGARPVRLNPHCSFNAGLGLFALRSMGATTVLRHVAQALRDEGQTRGGNLLRRDNVESIRVTCVHPVRLQVDGDYLGRRREVTFTSIPNALRVVA